MIPEHCLLVLSVGPPRPSSYIKEIYLPQRDRGQGIRQRQEIKDEGKGGRKKGEGGWVFVLKKQRTASG